MKFKVFNEEKEEQEKEVFFKLEETIHGSINLIAADKNGDRLESGNILRINAGGAISLNSDLNRNIGLSLDKDNGCAVVITESTI